MSLNTPEIPDPPQIFCILRLYLNLSKSDPLGASKKHTIWRSPSINFFWSGSGISDVSGVIIDMLTCILFFTEVKNIEKPSS